jgi:hypothetical protein
MPPNLRWWIGDVFVKKYYLFYNVKNKYKYKLIWRYKDVSNKISACK